MEKSDIEMLKSCYAYDSLGSRYYDAIVKKYGKRVTNREVKKIQSMYKVVRGVHTDHEGCTYNSLILK